MAEALIEAMVRRAPLTDALKARCAGINVSAVMVHPAASCVWTLLEYACRNVLPSYVRWLLHMGANPNASPPGCYPAFRSLLFATTSEMLDDGEFVECVSLLLDHGAQVDPELKGDLPGYGQSFLRGPSRFARVIVRHGLLRHFGVRLKSLEDELEQCRRQALIATYTARKRLGRDLGTLIGQLVWDERMK